MTTNPPANVAGHRDGIISISPQTLASLSASYPTSYGRHIPSRTLLRRIRHFLARSENGAWSGVWDTTFARHLSLIEHVKEFRERQVRARDKGKAKVGGGGAVAVGDSSLQDLPMLASACPGWICYVEKSCGHLLGLVSETRSPQAVMGALAKQWWAARHQRRWVGLLISPIGCYVCVFLLVV
jgi:iron only hydrogenase large subunit-like protein